MNIYVLLGFLIAYTTAVIGIFVYVEITWNRRAKKEKEAMREIHLQKGGVLTLDPIEFDRHLCWVFSSILEKVAFSNVTAADPDAKKILTEKSLAEFIAYFGTISNDIDNAYGESYLTRWATLKMSRLIIREKINDIINHRMTAEDIFMIIAVPVRVSKGMGK